MHRFLIASVITLWVLVGAVFYSRSHSSPDITPTPTPTPWPAVSKFNSSLPLSRGSPPPQVSARHIFILDRGSKLVLLAISADDQIYPASTTKMMTALVTSNQYALDTPLTVVTSYPEGTDIGLRPGEKVTVESLLYALLVQSANDAAEVLAENYCTPSKFSGQGKSCGREVFVSAMNAMADKLHLLNTHFLNPTGLDEVGHYSSASDLARLADSLMANANLRRIVSTENAVIASADFNEVHPVANVNELLGKIPGVLGIKTGFTDLAGESLVTLVSRDGHEVIFSVMGSTDRFTDTIQLIDWVYSNFTWK